MKAAYFTPLLHVSDIERSIRFYQLLGFSLIDTQGQDPIQWARLHCEGGAVMFLRAEHPIDPAKLRVFASFMYTPDLVGLQKILRENGVKTSEISYPEYMPSGEMSLSDPDGYVFHIAHWGKKEQEDWESHLKAK